MRAVYVAHPLRGKTGSPEEIKANLERIDELMKNLSAIYPDTLLLSPIHVFSFYDPRGDQTQVLEQCFELLERVDEMWVFGDWKESEGCLQEVEYAIKRGMDVRDGGA